MISGPRNQGKMSNVGRFYAKQSTTSPKEQWWSYHVLKLMYCVKTC